MISENSRKTSIYNSAMKICAVAKELVKDYEAREVSGEFAREKDTFVSIFCAADDILGKLHVMGFSPLVGASATFLERDSFCIKEAQKQKEEEQEEEVRSCLALMGTRLSLMVNEINDICARIEDVARELEEIE